MGKAKRIRTVLYNDQRITRTELELLHTQMFQRLYGLHQLGLADRVFIDASHSRLHHVVGVLEQVEKLISATTANLRRTGDYQLRYGATGENRISPAALADRVEAALPVARLIGFLHDLTHAPYGHTVEDEIELMATKHDDPARQAAAYYRLICDLIGWLGADLGEPMRKFPLSDAYRAYLRDPDVNAPPAVREVIGLGSALLQLDHSETQLFWRINPAEARILLAQLHVAMRALLHLELLHTVAPKPKHFPQAKYDFEEAIEAILRNSGGEPLLEEFNFDPHRDAYLLDIVGNTVCADILDYAQRDAHYANLKLTYDADRIAENFTVVSWRQETYEFDATPRTCPPGMADPFCGYALRAAISLFSHKLRTDIPGELMNLLNVRFYLYERAIYHPTKTAAGAMLGTALQLLGWTPAAGAAADILPEWLRYVGDDVFVFAVHRSANAAHLALSGAEDVPSSVKRLGGAVDVRELQLARNILEANAERSRAEVLNNLSAAIDLLARLRARRFVKPVFRALPNVAPAGLDATAATMAKLFKDPVRRFQTERQIETDADLPRGAIMIHCPRLNTAEKIANVLLVVPPMVTNHSKVAARIRKLRHINHLVDKVFDAHAQAIGAVEQMYTSMWRLVVYVVPEYFHRWEEIEAVTGRRLFEALADRPAEADDESLPNDYTLRHEITLRTNETAPMQEDPTPRHDIPTIIAALADAISEQDDVAPRVAARELEGIVERIRRERHDREQKRLSRLTTIARPYFGGKVASDTRTALERELAPLLRALDDSGFETFITQAQSRIAATPTTGAPFFRDQLNTFVAEMRAILSRIPSSPQHASDSTQT